MAMFYVDRGDEEEKCPDLLNEDEHEAGLGVKLQDLIKLDDSPPPTPPEAGLGRVRQMSEGGCSLYTASSTDNLTRAMSPLHDAREEPEDAQSAPSPPVAFRNRAFALPPQTPQYIAVPSAPQVWPATQQTVWVPHTQQAPNRNSIILPVYQQPTVAVQQPRRAVTLAPGGVEVLQQQVAFIQSQQGTQVVAVQQPQRAQQTAQPAAQAPLQMPAVSKQQKPAQTQERARQSSEGNGCTNAYSLFIAKELEQAEGSTARWPRAHTSQAKSRKGALLQRLRQAADKWESMSEAEKQPYVDEAKRNGAI